MQIKITYKTEEKEPITLHRDLAIAFLVKTDVLREDEGELYGFINWINSSIKRRKFELFTAEKIFETPTQVFTQDFAYKYEAKLLDVLKHEAVENFEKLQSLDDLIKVTMEFDEDYSLLESVIDEQVITRNGADFSIIFNELYDDLEKEVEYIKQEDID